MATTTTFNTLQLDVSNYLERNQISATDPVFQAQLPRLINLAERAIARDMKVEGQQNTVSAVMQAGLPVYGKPDRWRKDISMNFGVGTAVNRTPLFLRTYEYCRSYWPNDTLTAQPRFYAEYDIAHWLICPTPDQAYPFEILYWQECQLLDVLNQENWLTDFAPQVLLYRTCLEATLFLQKPAGAALFEKFYDNALESINAEDKKQLLDRGISVQSK